MKIQRSRVDYGFKFQTLKGGKYVLNSWVRLKKSETKSFMIIVINSEELKFDSRLPWIVNFTPILPVIQRNQDTEKTATVL